MTETAITDRDTSLELTVLMPCLNEAETVATCVEKAIHCMSQLGVCGEVLVADNGSTDGSQELAIGAGARVVTVKQKGYGAALRSGIAAARSNYVIMADADDSYSLDDLGAFVEKLAAGADLVMGNRMAGTIHDGAMPWLHRYLGNPVLSWIGRLLFKTPIGDFHCGMRGFRKDKIEELGLASSGMEFASEMIVKATLADLNITEVPTDLRPDGRSRAPHLRTWRDGWRHLRFLLAFSPEWLFLYPGFIATILGVTGILWLLPSNRVIGSVSFGLQSMLFFSVLAFAGVQAMLFSVMSRQIATELGILSRSRRIQRIAPAIRLEPFAIVGVVLLLFGLIGMVSSIVRWGVADFGALDVQSAMRLALVAALSFMIGLEFVLIGFVLSLVHVERLDSSLVPIPPDFDRSQPGSKDLV